MPKRERKGEEEKKEEEGAKTASVKLVDGTRVQSGKSEPRSTALLTVGWL